MEPTKLRNVIMAVLFASEEPISTRKLCAIVDDAKADAVHAAIDEIRDLLKNEAPSIVLEEIAGGLQLSTNSEYAEYVGRLYSGKRKQRLSRAAMETLAIIAYKQPITRADVENVRGVGAGGVITTLMERGLIRITGKAKILGAPFLYGTTPEFLEYLGLNTLKDLPSMEELERLLEREEESDASDGESAVAATDGGDGHAAADVETVDAQDADVVDGEAAPDEASEAEDGGFGKVEGDVDDKLLGAEADGEGVDEAGESAAAEEVVEDELTKTHPADEPA